jgi:hypothetical protein
MKGLRSLWRRGEKKAQAAIPCSNRERSRRLERTDLKLGDAALGSQLHELPSQTKKDAALEQLAHLVAKAAPSCVQNRRYYSEFFQLWQEAGIHITPVHFYHPIPDTRDLPAELWKRRSDLPGIEMNDSLQLEFLRDRFPQFRQEYDQFPITAGNPDDFSLINGRFDGVDALAAYCMVRYFKPHTVIEVGSGYSSLIMAQAAVKNRNSSLICIEPHPLEFLRKGVPGLRTLVQKRVEELNGDFFSQLNADDILFLDSSHTVKIGGDVNYLFLEVLPRLKPGVIVHVHDIFFPFDYPRTWVLDECRFWSEQYLLQAFLAFNSDFEILLCNSYLATCHLEELKAAFPRSPSWGGGSFWMRRKNNATSVRAS